MTFFSAHYFYSGFYTPAYFDDYFKALQSKSLEEITEHSHRMPLENLLNAIAQHHGHKLQVLHEPKRTQGLALLILKSPLQAVLLVTLKIKSWTKYSQNF